MDELIYWNTYAPNIWSEQCTGRKAPLIGVDIRKAIVENFPDDYDFNGSHAQSVALFSPTVNSKRKTN